MKVSEVLKRLKGLSKNSDFSVVVRRRRTQHSIVYAIHEESWPRERSECFGSASTSPTMLPQKKRIFGGALKQEGWYLDRQRDSHRQFKHDSKSGRVTVAGKLCTEIPSGTLNGIYKQAGWKK